MPREELAVETSEGRAEAAGRRVMPWWHGIYTLFAGEPKPTRIAAAAPHNGAMSPVKPSSPAALQGRPELNANWSSLLSRPMQSAEALGDNSSRTPDAKRDAKRVSWVRKRVSRVLRQLRVLSVGKSSELAQWQGPATIFDSPVQEAISVLLGVCARLEALGMVVELQQVCSFTHSTTVVRALHAPPQKKGGLRVSHAALSTAHGLSSAIS